jgi:hypothetical protein
MNHKREDLPLQSSLFLVKMKREVGCFEQVSLPRIVHFPLLKNKKDQSAGSEASSNEYATKE